MDEAYVAETRCSIWLEQIFVVRTDANNSVPDVQ
jgi:hypothetical protein